MRSHRRLGIGALLALALAACSNRTGHAPREDAGSGDGGRVDATLVDSGIQIDGTVPNDATHMSDASMSDGGLDSSVTLLDMGSGRDASSAADAGHASCAAMAAMGTGDCDAVLGYSWVGSRCSAISGCTCVGEDCGRLYASREECSEVHRECTMECGGRTGTVCPDGTYCNYPLIAMCGIADGTGLCDEVPEGCPEIFAPVCGCDAMTYGNGCEAAQAGISVNYEGDCEEGDGRD